MMEERFFQILVLRNKTSEAHKSDIRISPQCLLQVIAFKMIAKRVWKLWSQTRIIEKIKKGQYIWKKRWQSYGSCAQNILNNVFYLCIEGSE